MNMGRGDAPKVGMRNSANCLDILEPLQRKENVLTVHHHLGARRDAQIEGRRGNLSMLCRLRFARDREPASSHVVVSNATPAPALSPPGPRRQLPSVPARWLGADGS